MFGHDAGFDIRVAEWAIRWVHNLTDVSCSAKPAKLAGYLLRSLSSAEKFIKSILTG
jgi:hypothetical protein